MNWPKPTEIGKFLAKERFYSHDAVSGTLKQALVEEVEKITISHRLARDTLNVDAGTEFPEILVLNIKLRQSKVNEKLLDALDKSIRSGYVLFMLEYNEKECASISHKTVNAKESCTIDKRWTTDWTDKVDLELRGTTSISERHSRTPHRRFRSCLPPCVRLQKRSKLILRRIQTALPKLSRRRS